MPLLMVFRAVALGALALGLLFLVGYSFRGAVDIHMLLGVLAVLLSWGVLWTKGRSVAGLSLAGAALAAVLLAMGIALRTGRLQGTPAGLTHLGVALAMISVVEAAVAKARRKAAGPR